MERIGPVVRPAVTNALILGLISYGVTALSACAPARVHSGKTFPDEANVEHLDPALAFRVLKLSPRQYRILPGRLRADSLVASYQDETPVDSWDLEGGAAQVWNEASEEALFGNYPRAVELYSALIEKVPHCSDCRVELARALLGMAARQGRPVESAEHLRREAADQLTIASALRPQIPVGRGTYVPPDWLGRTNIPLQPKHQAVRDLLSSGNDAYNAGDLSAARRAYLQVLREEPQFGRGYVAVGDTYSDGEDWQEAILWYWQALRVDSTDYLAWRSLAECYEALGQADAARDAALWAVIYNYQDADSWEVLTRIKAALGHSVSRCRLDKRVEVEQAQDGAVSMIVDSTLRGPAQTAWLGYGFIRTVWRYEGRFAMRHPGAQRYRPTFDEEMEAAAALAAVWGSRQNDTTGAGTLSDPQLERLWRIAEAGYLGEYVMYEEMAADNPDLMAHLPPATLARIREYVERFVVGGLAL